LHRVVLPIANASVIRARESARRRIEGRLEEPKLELQRGNVVLRNRMSLYRCLQGGLKPYKRATLVKLWIVDTDGLGFCFDEGSPHGGRVRRDRLLTYLVWTK
jgi:hypothetical protein